MAGKIFPMIRAPRPTAFTVEREAILDAAAFIARNVVERRNTIPILSNVVVTVGDGVVTLSGNDLDMEATFTVPARIDASGEAFTVDAAMLADAVKAAAKGSLVGLSYDPATGRATINGGACMTLATLPVADAPQMRGPDAAAFTIDAATLTGDAARLVPFMGKSETRYYLMGVEAAADADGFTLTATDGVNLARVTREPLEDGKAVSSVLIPAKAVKALAKRAKGAAGLASVEIDADRYRIVIGAMVLVGKLVDGSFPPLAKLLARLEGAQHVAFPDLEPGLSPVAVEAMRKAFGALPTIAAGDGCYSFTSPDAPELLGIVSPDMREAAGKMSYPIGDYRAACDYLRDLARGRGFTVEDDTPTDLRMRRGLVLGMTFGAVLRGEVKAGERYARPGTDGEYADAVERAESEGLTRMMPSWECFTVQATADAAMPALYADGAFSVAMPRERADMAAAIVFHAPDGTGYPLRAAIGGNGITGAIELPAAAVARLVGEIDPATLIDIPAPSYWHGKPVPAGWSLPKAPRIAKGDALRMTAAEMRAYADACRPVRDAAPVEAAPIAMPVVEAETVADVTLAPVEPVAAPVEASTPVIPSPAPVDGLAERVAALEAIVARLSRPVEAGKRVRSEGERRAIVRAWRMRGEARAARIDAARMAADMVALRASVVAHRERGHAAVANAALFHAAADAADRRAGRMVRAAARHRTAGRRLADDLRGSQAEARALARRLEDAARPSTRNRVPTAPYGAGTPAALAA